MNQAYVNAMKQGYTRGMQPPAQGDRYAETKKANPVGFYGPTLMKQYGGNTSAIDQRMQAWAKDAPALAASAPRPTTNNAMGTNSQPISGNWTPSGPGFINNQALHPNQMTGGGFGGRGPYNPGTAMSPPSSQPGGWDPSQLWQMLSQLFGTGGGWGGGM